MVKVAPSVLSANFAHLKEDIEKIEKGTANIYIIFAEDRKRTS